MKSLMGVIVFTVSFSVLAEEKDLSNYKKMDLNQFNGISATTKKNDSSITFTSSCTDDRGQIFKSTESGYDACMYQKNNKIESPNKYLTGFSFRF